MDYEYALERLKELGINLGLAVTDCDSALINAISIVYPHIPTVLYTWHINKCVLANCKGTVSNKEWPAFDSA